tara:strand:- start:51859 stop:52653 length:795 start_codon:yes stop_codon:yes gene_type:complete
MQPKPLGPCLSPALITLGVILSGCVQPSVDPNTKTELLVYAASSLTGPFTEIEDAFEKAIPQVDVRMVFAGSQALRLQIEQGAPADIFASANQTHMDALIRGKHIEKSHYFASNELALIVPNNNPAGVETFADLASTSLLVLGSDNVPVGTYTEQLLDRAELELGEGFKARVQGQAVSFENNVRLVRSKVEMGEANAAIVYLTESMSPSLKIVSIPGHLRVPIRYPVGALAASSQPLWAKEFIAYLLSTRGKQLLSEHLFQVPQ